jgi:cytosine deaminase
MLVQGAHVDGRRVDLRFDGPTVAAIGDLTPRPGEVVLLGGLLAPPSAEPHVHLDAVLLGARTPNRSGTLREGIANWAAIRPTLTHEDVLARARTVVDWYGAHGTLRVRTHVDTGSRVAVEALLALRESLRGQVELQVVAFPQEGILRGPGRQEAWEEAVAMGCDAVGAIPHFERTTEEGWRTVRMAFDLAEKHGVRVDLHCDETDDPGSRNLEVVCAEALDRGLQGRVVAGHCTALHSYPNPYAAKIVELVAASGVQVVANPLDNVVLQGRYDTYPRRRGITRVDALWAAGACVGVGHDSVMDPWYRLGTANLVDAAYMLVHVAQLTSEDEMRRVVRTLWTENHRPFGDPPSVRAGGPATFVWWPVADEIELLRTRPTPRVFVNGTERT